MNNQIAVFEQKKIRHIEHEGEMYFSVVDIIEALTDSPNPNNYWAKLKSRGEQLVTVCHRLKMAATDGRQRVTDCANTVGVFRIIMSVPSPKAEPFKTWLASLGKRELDEMNDPELGFDRLREIYQAQGYTDECIKQRLQTIDTRKKLTDEWKKRGVKEGHEYSILTAVIAKGTFGMTPSEHKNLKGLEKQNLRDHMTDLELIFTALGESATKIYNMKKYLFFLLILVLGCKNVPEKKAVSDESEQKELIEVLSEKYPFGFCINGPAGKVVKMTTDKIELTSEKETDFFIEPGAPPYQKANAPLLLNSVDNTKPFTFSFKVTPVHNVKYDAGMAFIYIDKKNWLKFAFEADERMNKRIVTVKTKDFSDDNNHDVVKSKSVFMKISSDAKVIGFYYSIDGKEWQLVRVFKNEYPSVIKVGIGTQSPAGNGNSSVFEKIDFSEQSVTDFRMGI